MLKNLAAMENVVIDRKNKFITYIKRHKRFLVIIFGVILLNIIYVLIQDLP
jgi:hypothetical protein